MDADHELHGKIMPFIHETTPQLPARPLSWSDGANWTGIVLRSYHLDPAEAPPATYAADILYLSLEGTTTLWSNIDGRQQHGPVHPGGICLVPRNVPGQFSWTQSVSTLHVYMLPSIVIGTIDEVSNLDPMHVELVSQFNVRDPLIQQISLALLAEIQSDSPLGRLYAESLARTLVFHLLRNYSSLSMTHSLRAKGLSRQQLHRVLTFIHDRLDQDLTLVELSSSIGLSPFWFTRLFKQSTGLAPHQYLIHSRVERARALLTEGKLTIAEVAHQVGFADQSHLSRHFKRLLGVSPKTVLFDGKNVQEASKNLQDATP